MKENIFHQILYKYWGYNSFRPLQEDIIHSVYDGNDVLGLMPTGGGKSITFQVPALAMDGLCLVITPLIALMKDQVDNLRAKGIKALSIYSGMSHQEIITTLENAILGDYKFLYISPERLGTKLFQQKMRDMNISLIAVDESHCISQWGYDFRPSYMNIASIREQLPQVPILALTATATSDVVDDIQNILQFRRKNVFRKSFERHNLAYIVRYTEDKNSALVNILNKSQGCTIVYVRSRIRAKEIADQLSKSGFSADYYHAGLPSYEKVKKQNAWKNDDCRIIVSTNAFGMGIDKPDVRVVVHMDLPNSLEEYYQEAGRAGRDENKAYAIILYNKTDITKLKRRVTDEFPERIFIKNVYDSLAYYFQIAEGFGAGSVYDFNLHHFCSVYKYPLIQTHNALKILELAGYIEYTDESGNKSRMIFNIYRDELYKYDFDKEYEHLINIILRLYTGIFADYVNIDEGEIGSHIGKTRKEVYEMLKIIGKRNIIDYIPFKKTPFIIYTQPRIDGKRLVIPKSVYEQRKERFEQRISGIIGYIEKKDVCRSRILLSYFGERNNKNCQQCDACLEKTNLGISNYKHEEILNSIMEILSNHIEGILVDDLVDDLDDFSKDNILSVIRFQVDQDILEIFDVNMIREKKSLTSQ